ncbi:MAG: N-acetylmuramoyl-L-alanine amidase [Gammaproteobacteria bacterium]|nr:MAG: N-acetylmuramoyl-L-alanine amidase [Gammaproteobacteria bacterium]
MQRKISRLALLAIGFLASVTQAGPRSELFGLQLSGDAANPRLVMDLNTPASHTLFALENPPRIVVDLHDTHVNVAAVRLPAAQGPIARVRTANRDNGDARVVMDLSAPARARSFLVPPDGDAGHRLIVDIGSNKKSPTVSAATPEAEGRDLVIAIDAGHGGKDPGATGRSGTREKDIALEIARRLAKKVDAEPGMRSYLTRDGDYFLTLRQRIQRARKHRADLFVSIHADAFKNRRARGSSVYVLSPRGATDEAARWLAERENSADLVGGVSLDDKDAMLASVLLDLSQSAAIDASTQVADQVLRRLSGLGPVHRKDVQKAGFVVLKSPDIPSILIETAFISNPSEEKQLRNRKHQERLASAIARGIRNYFTANPPPGTLLASRQTGSGGAVEHVIVRGDTLSDIANRYSITLRELRRHNGLKGDRIRIGQVLRIPLYAGS